MDSLGLIIGGAALAIVAVGVIAFVHRAQRATGNDGLTVSERERLAKRGEDRRPSATGLTKYQALRAQRRES